MKAIKSRIKTHLEQYQERLESRIEKIRTRPEVWELFGILLKTDDLTLSRTFRWAEIGPSYLAEPKVRRDFVTVGYISTGPAVSWDLQMLEIIVEVCFSFAIFKTDFGGLVWLKYDDYTFHPQEIPGEYGWWVYAPRAETVGVKCAYETELLNLFRGYAETPRKRDKEYKPIPLLKKLHKELFKGS